MPLTQIQRFLRRQLTTQIAPTRIDQATTSIWVYVATTLQMMTLEVASEMDELMTGSRTLSLSEM